MNDMAIEYARRPISVEDYHKMADAGIFAPDERVELLDGELIAVPPMNPPHGGRMTGLTMLLAQRLGSRAAVRIGLPVIVDPYSEPEPDVALVPLPLAQWNERHPDARDVYLLIEVADSSRAFDLKRKSATYARAGITDYWVLDVRDRRLIVHREPGEGRYATVQILKPEERVQPLAFPGEWFELSDLVGP